MTILRRRRSPLVRYADAMRDALCEAGVPRSHAADAANNLAFPLADDATLDVATAFRARLVQQRAHFGLGMTNVAIAAAADAAARVPRYVEDACRKSDASRAAR